MEAKLKATHHGIVNEGSENEFQVFGYRTKRWRQALCYVGYVLSLGLIRFLLYWKQEMYVWFVCNPCSLEEADILLLRTTDEQKKCCMKKVKSFHVANVSHIAYMNNNTAEKKDSKELPVNTELKVRYMHVQKMRYIWNPFRGTFQKSGVLDDTHSCSDIHTKFASGFSKEEQDNRRQICGSNSIEVEITPIWKLLFREILNPVYCFEAYALILWLSAGYIEYSMAILILTILSIIATVTLLRMQSVKLHKMVEFHNNVMVTVLRKTGDIEEVQSQNLVPGDVIILPEKKMYLPCDAILISGGCVINEGMLTGECVPVTKTPLPCVDNCIPWNVYTGDNYKEHMLYCGTEVTKTKPDSDGLVKAVVLHTGFNTTKGDLVRSILYPKPIKFKLYKDVFWVIAALSVVSVFGLIYSVVVGALQGAEPKDLVLMGFIMLTCAVPVSLPPALAVCVLYSQNRLKKHGIFCISPDRISLCGQLNLICFDKTGTLTEEGLDLWGIVPSRENCFQEAHHFTSGSTLPWGPLLGAVASCHSLIVLDGAIHGDPLDFKMFEGSGWNIDESQATCTVDGKCCSCVTVKPGSGSKVPVDGINILLQFPFSSALQRMSVVAQVIGEQRLTLFLKGAPEMVVRFCKQETVPSSFKNTLDYYTEQGFRVISLAYKYFELEENISLPNLKREEVESDLIFLGFLIMENQLKPETKPVLQELVSANLRTVMLTGDNLKTACTVGMGSGMVPSTDNVFLLEATEYEEGTQPFINWQILKRNKDNDTKLNETTVNILCTDNAIKCNTIQNKLDYATSGTYYSTDKQNLPELMMPNVCLLPSVFADVAPSVAAVAFSTGENIQSESPSSHYIKQHKYHYAMTGNSYQTIKQHFPDLMPDILLNGTIFARMTPKQKSTMIEDLQNIDYYVGMCGDGANDCGALKMAHAGISLSELEASVASPFTSKITNITCMPILLKEGRNVFVTYISLFKYMVMYAFIGLICMFLMFWEQTILGSNQYLMQDIAITIPLMLTLSLNGPAPKLAPYRPAGRLLLPPLLLSIILHLSFTLTVQMCAYFVLQQQPWFSRTDVFYACIPQNMSFANQTSPMEYDISQNFFTSTCWLITGINLIIIEFVFSKGRPFRQPIYTNYIFLMLVVAQVAVYMFFLFADIESLYSALKFVCMPYYWRGIIFAMVFALFAVSYFIEECILENRSLWLRIYKMFNCKYLSHFKELQKALEMNNHPSVVPRKTYRTNALGPRENPV
ncbi:probable cation-transporting ATPase 13A4 isoform X2 [Xenopus tropicalis]|uniref:Cation-transporting ATPase n=1 Tax=Xenopus tropicalis TaxID=8364 RepID=A0A8J0QZA4_XENTR|nr:probable cation-transporting ATPase 13A4 isoform X2 [Xenopus tropicalis]